MIRLLWGHISNKAISEPGGLLTLERIHWFFEIPSMLDFILLKAGSLTALLVADEVKDLAIPVTVELTGPTGQVIGRSYIVEGRFEQSGAGSPLFRPIRIDLDPLLLTIAGQYSFKIRVDGELVGRIGYDVYREAPPPIPLKLPWPESLEEVAVTAPVDPGAEPPGILVPPKRARKRGLGTCAMCGLSRNVTADHIPAQNLFLSPHTNDLITVPSCDSCNEGTSKDDEYFRIALALRSDSASHPSLLAMREEILRGLEYPESKDFSNYLKGRTTRRLVTAPDGSELEATVHQVDDRAISRVIKRITRGLYFHNVGSSLPAGLGISVIPEISFGTPVAAFIHAQIKPHPLIEIGRGEFSYQGFFKPAEAEEASALVLYTFYGALPFLSVVAPPGWLATQDVGAEGLL